MAYQSIIIQNFFRSGGSYLYNQFIDYKDVMGFYEPFHNVFTSEESFIKEEKEFFLKTKNLKHFSNEFYFKNYPTNLKWFKDFHKVYSPIKLFDTDIKNKVEFIKYLERLKSFANDKNFLPVFKINRMYLNPDTINLSNSFKIFIFRNPISSFFSNIGLNLLIPYYELIELYANKGIEFFIEIQKFIVSQKLEKIKIQDGNIRFFDRNQMESHFSVFFLVWFYGLDQNLKKKFFIIDYDKLQIEKYQKIIQSSLYENLNLHIDFHSFEKKMNKLYDMQINLKKEIKNIFNKFFDQNILKIYSEDYKIEYLNNYL